MNTEEIEDEIERTRFEMASTLNAIERKLSPKQIMDQAVDTMRELASDQSRVAQVVRDNPLPLALIGLGIGWLAVSGSVSRKADAEEGSYESMEGVAPSWGSALGGAASGIESAAAYGTAGSADYTSAVTAEGRELRDRASQLAGTARDKLSRVTGDARGRVSQWSQQAKGSANQAVERTRDAFDDHPLTMGLVAGLAGIVVGALLPRSRVEREGLSGVAGDVVQQVRQAGSELAEKAGRVTERAAQAAKDEGERVYRQETGLPSNMTH